MVGLGSTVVAGTSKGLTKEVSFSPTPPPKKRGHKKKKHPGEDFRRETKDGRMAAGRIWISPRSCTSVPVVESGLFHLKGNLQRTFLSSEDLLALRGLDAIGWLVGGGDEATKSGNLGFLVGHSN